MRRDLRRQYDWSARLYDVASAEPVYRTGRREGVAGLRLGTGDRVLDVGCGTGLNLPLLRDAVGAAGVVVGVDLSDRMLARAAARSRRLGWRNVELVHADAEVADLGHERFDAVIATYALSLMPDWPAAWQRMLAAAAPGARLAVVDMQRPPAGSPWRTLAARPLARAACALGGSDIDAHPWTALERDLVDVQGLGRRAGHVQVRAGTKPGRAEDQG